GSTRGRRRSSRVAPSRWSAAGASSSSTAGRPPRCTRRRGSPPPARTSPFTSSRTGCGSTSTAASSRGEGAASVEDPVVEEPEWAVDRRGGEAEQARDLGDVDRLERLDEGVGLALPGPEPGGAAEVPLVVGVGRRERAVEGAKLGGREFDPSLAEAGQSL